MSIEVKYLEKVDAKPEREPARQPDQASPAMQKAEDATRPITPTIVDRMAVYSSNLLFKGAKEVVIEHNGDFYRLKITRQNKLILNK